MYESEMTRKLKFYIVRFLLYAALIGFGLIMLFPFIYMVASSLKTSDDVTSYPPRILPRSPERTEFEGEERILYRIEVDGEERLMVVTDEQAPRLGFFAEPQNLNADDPRSTLIEHTTDFDAGVEDGTLIDLEQEVVVESRTGRERSFDLYDVEIDGEFRTLALAFRTRGNIFVDPEDPTVTAIGSVLRAQRVEFVELQLGNYNAVLELDMDRALVNTTFVTILVVAGQVITSIFGGYAFSRIPFRGRNALFLMYLGSYMVPFVVLIIPMYRLMVAVGWQGRIVSLIVPWIFTVYGTFLLRQFFMSIPREIEEAALLDGAGRFRILWGIFVPLSKPALAALTIFSFLYAWNSFLWPLIIIGEGNVDNHVLTLSLIRLNNAAATEPNLALTGAAIAILPPIFIFILAQKYFIEGIATSGLKG